MCCSLQKHLSRRPFGGIMQSLHVPTHAPTSCGKSIRLAKLGAP
jgi:hypothetical protein